MFYYQKESGEAIKELESNLNGLNNSEVNLRLKKYGKNEIKKIKSVSVFKLLISQFKSFVIYILLFAFVVSLLTREFTDAIVIGIILVLNALLGFYQEFKAEKAIESLKRLSSPKAIVIRNSKISEVDSAEIVPGDILVIEEGSYIAADARLIDISSLQVDESTLTGESTTVSKKVDLIKEEKQLADQKNMVFAGTMATKGRAKAVVVSTGFNTELGKIAKEIQVDVERETPLQNKLNKIGIYISAAVVIISIIVIFLDYLNRGFTGDVFESLKLGIAIAVAAIPEGLPAVVTITLALGAQRMLKNNALIRRLTSVETLGSTTIISSDKTGTLTKNEMTVTQIYSQGKLFNITGKGYDITGDFVHNNKKVDTELFGRLFETFALCNNATLYGPSDPTEKALLVLSTKAGYVSNATRLEEIPFSSEAKSMTTIDEIENKKIWHIKGACEVILEKCKYIDINRKKKLITPHDKELILDSQNKMASKALRVLAAAYSENDKDYVFLGLAGMIDPPRKEVSESILECKQAGIDVIMVTGDHEITARAIAREIGISGDSITGKEIDNMPIEKLSKLIKNIKIFSRVDPKHKVKILEALKSNGEIVAMTGDGVNDALALKKSDIGIAVGAGTDVAKEAADMVLTDNNFVSIVKAVKEGRGIYNNIKKFILFLFSSNLAEVLIILLALIGGLFLEGGLPLPILAIQLLWVNIITDGLPALALGVDPIRKDIMKTPPRNPKEKIITKNDTIKLIYQGLVITISTLIIFFMFLNIRGLVYAQTMAFTTLVVLELFNSLNYRVGGNTVFSRETFANKYLLLAILSSFALQVLVVYGLPGLFKTTSLILFDWLWILIASLPIIFVQELIKLVNPNITA